VYPNQTTFEQMKGEGTPGERKREKQEALLVCIHRGKSIFNLSLTGEKLNERETPRRG